MLPIAIDHPMTTQKTAHQILRHEAHLPALDLGDVLAFLRCKSPNRVEQHPAELAHPEIDVEYVEQNGGDVGRAGRVDFRIAPDDDRVGMMARVTPPPGRWLPHHEEGCDLVDDVVHPRGLESSAMAAFVPARIRSRRVERAIDEEGGESPPRAPGLQATPPLAASEANQIRVSRIAGPSLRFISALSWLRGIGQLYHSAAANPFLAAAALSSPTML